MSRNKADKKILYKVLESLLSETIKILLLFAFKTIQNFLGRCQSNAHFSCPEISDIRTAHAPNSLTIWLPITRVNCMKQMIKIKNRNVYNLVEKFAEVLGKC